MLRLKVLIIPRFLYEGTYHKDVRVLYNPLENDPALSAEDFDVFEDKFYLEDVEIDRLSKEQAIIEFHGKCII